MRLELLAGVSAEPVSLDQAKLWVRVDHSADDALISGLISAARDHVEAVTGLALAPQSWRLAVPPSALPAEMPRPPFGSLTTASALLSDGTVEEVPTTDLLAIGVEPARVGLRAGASLPPGTLEVRIDYACALPNGVPPRAVQAMKMLIAHWYENREAAVASTDEMREPPHAVTALLDTLKLARL